MLNKFQCCFGTLVTIFAALGFSDCARAQDVPEVLRFADNPIIRPEMLIGDDGANINGPSLIRVPAWVEKPLGRYYLYFAHHEGTYIRLAYADDLEGPWTVYDPGTLRLTDTACNDISQTSWAANKHIASPDVHIHAGTRQIRMYFHCPAYISGPEGDSSSYKQVTFVATSTDGISFEANPKPPGDWYFRVFEWGDYYYALAMPGVFYRSRDGMTGFEKGPTLFNQDMRHSALKIMGDRLLVFYTQVGEIPERILLAEIKLGKNWNEWSETGPLVVLEPEYDWEGAKLPHKASTRGEIMAPVRQLRDPAIFEDGGDTYLLYSVAGEAGIAIAKLHWN